MEEKQTAVKWLVKYMETYFHLTDDSREAFKVALEKEKEQICQAYLEGLSSILEHRDEEEYYDETYIKKIKS